jgi:hypothetical protein
MRKRFARQKRARQVRRGKKLAPRTIAVLVAPNAPTHRRRALLGIGAIALAAVSFAEMSDAAPSHSAVVAAPLVEMPAQDVKLEAATPLPPSWGASLPAVTVLNENTGASASLRLYSAHGSIELPALREFIHVVNGDVPSPLDTRLIQLVFRAAYHFDGAPITIVSGTRLGAHGKHATGEALDFKLEGVSAAALAKYARAYPRAGIGIYTHPKTQYIHLDVRAHSYHWSDGSPPGITWRETLLDDPTQQKRDDSYLGTMDMPEAASP